MEIFRKNHGYLSTFYSLEVVYIQMRLFDILGSMVKELS
jgi:hypothetical protein